MTKYFLFGYFGQDNTGDDAMLYGWLLGMAKQDKAFILAKKPCVVPAGANVEFVPYGIPSVMIAILRSDSFVLVGGTHFSDYGIPARNAWIATRIFILSAVSSLLGKTVTYDAIGVNCRSRWFRPFLNYLRIADRITVRDYKSQEILNSLHIKSRVVPDLSSRLPVKKQPRESGLLCINVSPLNQIYTGEKYAYKDDQMLRDVMQCVVKQHYLKIKILVFDTKSVILSEKLAGLLRYSDTEIEYYSPDPTHHLNIIARCCMLIGVKYHACYFAKLTGTPYIDLSPHTKNNNLSVSLLKMIGVKLLRLFILITNFNK